MSGRQHYEGIELAEHGDGHQEVALFAYQTAHAVALGADDDDGGTFQVGLIERSSAAHGGAVDPQTLFFQILEQGGQVGDPGDGQIGDGAGGGFTHHGGQTGGAALGDDDAVGARALGGADDRAQIVGIGQLVAHHDEGSLSLFAGGVEDVLHAGVLPHGGHGDDALVGVGAAHEVQLAPVGLHHHHVLGAGLGGNVAQSGVGLALGQIDFVDGDPGAQGLDHRVAAFNDAVGLGGQSGVFFFHIRSSCGRPMGLGQKRAYFL